MFESLKSVTQVAEKGVNVLLPVRAIEYPVVKYVGVGTVAAIVVGSYDILLDWEAKIAAAIYNALMPVVVGGVEVDKKNKTATVNVRVTFTRVLAITSLVINGIIGALALNWMIDAEDEIVRYVAGFVFATAFLSTVAAVFGTVLGDFEVIRAKEYDAVVNSEYVQKLVKEAAKSQGVSNIVGYEVKYNVLGFGEKFMGVGVLTVSTSGTKKGS